MTKKELLKRKREAKAERQWMNFLCSYGRNLEAATTSIVIDGIEVIGRGSASQALQAFIVGYYWKEFSERFKAGKSGPFQHVDLRLGLDRQRWPNADFRSGKRNLFGLEFKKVKGQKV